MAELQGKAAIVTGSTRGIGRAIAQALAHGGANVVVSSRSSRNVDDAARSLASAAPGKVLGFACDVRDPDACARLVAFAVERLGRLDILVNNAGVGIFQSILDTSVDDFRLQVETNLSGVFYVCRSVAREMLRQEPVSGRIIVLGGTSAESSDAASAATRAGVAALVSALDAAWQAQGIRVSLLDTSSEDKAVAEALRLAAEV